MKKFIFGVIALAIVVGIVVTAIPYLNKDEDEEQYVDVWNEESSDGINIETLSDEDIYYEPDTIVPYNYVVLDMVDMANAYAIMRAAYCDAELWVRFGMVVNDGIRQLKTDRIKNTEIRKVAEQYVKNLIEILPEDTAMFHGPDSVILDQVWNEYTKYGDWLVNHYNLSQYGKINEEEIIKYMKIEQFIPNFKDFYELRHKQSKENEEYLLKMIEQTQSFDRECLYTIEYAHQLRYEENHPAIKMMEKLMKSGKYSRYLPEVWLTWRCMKQLDLSLSRDGEIHNLEYNKMRYHCLNTIIREIIKDPKNVKAINSFAYLATYTNITRFSQFMFGNSVGIEHMELFPEIMEEED